MAHKKHAGKVHTVFLKVSEGCGTEELSASVFGIVFKGQRS